MKKKHRIIAVLVLFFLVVIIVVGSATYKHLENIPPDKEIKSAIEALASVKKSQADKFAAKKYLEAEKVFEQAMDEWKIQNERFFLKRDYTKVRSLANQTIELCMESINDGSSEKTSLNSQVKKQLATLKKKINQFEKYYKNLPLEKSVFQQFSKARLKCDEAETSYKHGQVHEAVELADEAEILITKASAKGKEKLEAFYDDYPDWEKNVILARELSSGGKIVVLVNKLESSCNILKSGKIIETFNAEFGKNWLGGKVRMGDKATPEGVYKVYKKKSGKETKYYKSLLINYPNEDDKSRFTALLKTGRIPKNSRIGNLIEIHGDGGKGVHWTDGCIAVTNDDMDKIYSLCSISTPVIIIGSEKPLKEYLK
ncbi:MAG: hypothetical protein COW63_03130 [Bacteroidetes bacterium CG18_big_fil_WC_8_21_14_2_50_41_14]|nr:MAG: hypothetical protein COW63_03130 [Bacteroidetes bacterium CG18_big_fil_WC_8_21_14_2_50_41_14]